MLSRKKYKLLNCLEVHRSELKIKDSKQNLTREIVIVTMLLACGFHGHFNSTQTLRGENLPDVLNNVSGFPK